MIIRVINRILTDQSRVWNVELAEDEQTIVLHAPDEKTAQNTAWQIQAAIQKNIGEEVKIVYSTKIRRA